VLNKRAPVEKALESHTAVVELRTAINQVLSGIVAGRWCKPTILTTIYYDTNDFLLTYNKMIEE